MSGEGQKRPVEWESADGIDLNEETERNELENSNTLFELKFEPKGDRLPVTVRIQNCTRKKLELKFEWFQPGQDEQQTATHVVEARAERQQFRVSTMKIGPAQQQRFAYQWRLIDP